MFLYTFTALLHPAIQSSDKGRSLLYLCSVVCNRLLYRKTVLEFKKDNYNSSSCLFTSVASFNGNMYICNTCHVTIKKKNKTPCQAVYNNLAERLCIMRLEIEFQMRGSPHLHSLIWTSDCPELKDGSEEAYTRYIDEHVQGSLPNRENDCQFHDLVNMYQKHTHSRSCKKYRNIPCRFNFGQFFTSKTVVSKPLPEDMPDA